jgi:S-methylmethionine-dependent homocysteine/selenocysteine methylase
VTAKAGNRRNFPDLRARLADSEALVLDGGNGTELERRGVPSELPLWSTHALIQAPEVVAAIHADYAGAGADLLTANTFRTQRRTLSRAGLGERAADLTRLAVDLARREALRFAEDRSIYVVGSAPPLEDCYRPDLVPAAAALEREHGEHAENLARAGVDAILAETMNCSREAQAAVRAARAAGKPVLVSFVCCDGPHLLSGESLRVALDAVLPEEPAAVLVNCLPASNVAACLPVLRASGKPFGAYCNLGAPTGSQSFARSEEYAPAELAELAVGWKADGARLLGGCCGTTPEHIRAIAQRLRS